MTNNCWDGFSTVSGSPNPWAGVTGDTGVEVGTVYNSPMSGSVVPGAGDLANVDPQFLDPTRRGDVGQ